MAGPYFPETPVVVHLIYADGRSVLIDLAQRPAMSGVLWGETIESARQSETVLYEEWTEESLVGMTFTSPDGSQTRETVCEPGDPDPKCRGIPPGPFIPDTPVVVFLIYGDGRTVLIDVALRPWTSGILWGQAIAGAGTVLYEDWTEESLVGITFTSPDGIEYRGTVCEPGDPDPKCRGTPPPPPIPEHALPASVGAGVPVTF